MVTFEVINTYGVFSNFGATDILALLGSQDPVSDVACARLGPRFRQTRWPLCFSASFAVVLENVSGVACDRLGPRLFFFRDRMHSLSALRLALLSCSKDVTHRLPSQ